MYTLQTNASFDSAHFLKGYEGKCSNIHGHRWNVEVTVAAEELVEEGQIRGMVVDFRPLQNDLKRLADDLDHCVIVEYFYDELEDMEYHVVLVKVYETPNNCAGYSR